MRYRGASRVAHGTECCTCSCMLLYMRARTHPRTCITHARATCLFASSLGDTGALAFLGPPRCSPLHPSHLLCAEWRGHALGRDCPLKRVCAVGRRLPERSSPSRSRRLSLKYGTVPYSARARQHTLVHRLHRVGRPPQTSRGTGGLGFSVLAVPRRDRSISSDQAHAWRRRKAHSKAHEHAHAHAGAR